VTFTNCSYVFISSLFYLFYSHTYKKRFTFNQATYGAAIYSDDDDSATANVTVESCHFHNNSAKFNGGALYILHDLVIQNSVFENNTALNGGVVYHAKFVYH
jgi:predicted outer membrane repeat protein